MTTILDANLPPFNFGKSPMPKRAGIGLKPQHVDDILSDNDGLGADIGFFEIHAENYMGAGGPPHAQLRRIRERYPISLHGVGMSIGSEQSIDPDHLARFKALADYYQPALVSEHLAWSTHDDIFFNDLLPVPYTNETLARVCEHVDQVQAAIGRQILIENPSTYVTFHQSDWSEFDYMAEIANRTGCGLLFDVNNVYISATNHKYSPEAYIDAYPLNKVQEIHLAGHATDSDDEGEALLIDAHDREVASDVWALFRQTLGHTGLLPSLIEWDNDVPDWPTLEAEAKLAEAVLNELFPAECVA